MIQCETKASSLVRLFPANCLFCLGLCGAIGKIHLVSPNHLSAGWTGSIFLLCGPSLLSDLEKLLQSCWNRWSPLWPPRSSKALRGRRKAAPPSHPTTASARIPPISLCRPRHLHQAASITILFQTAERTALQDSADCKHLFVPQWIFQDLLATVCAGVR